MVDPSDLSSTRPAASAWALAALMLAATVAFDPDGWASFGPVKWAAVTALTLLAISLRIFEGPIAIHRGSGIAWLAFLAWGVVGSVAAVDPLYSWIGTPDRHLGLLAWGLLAALFAAGQGLEPAAVRLVLRTAAVSLVVIGAYALLELAGAAPVDLATASSRPGGPFGSPAYIDCGSSSGKTSAGASPCSAR